MIANPSPVMLNDEIWDRVVGSTGGAMLACYQCGTCTAICPWGRVRGEPLSVRRLIRSAQLGADGASGPLWLCATCKFCETRCPRGVGIVDSILMLRALAHESRRAPPPLEESLWRVYEDGNPWGGKPGERARWAEGLELKEASAGVEVLYYVGCSVAYDRRLQRIARATARLLQAAGVDFGILGDREKCCGDVVRSVGDEAYLQELAESNIALFRATGAQLIVTSSPHCLEMIKNVYPRYGGQFKVMHATELIASLLEDGKVRFDHTLEKRITYHDPCYLGRYQGTYEAPRRILGAVPGLELVEMKENRENALCCGGGGGRMWLETPPGERLSDLRVQQAADTGAALLATACPNCIQNFEASVKTAEIGDMEVLDVVELAAQALSS